MPRVLLLVVLALGCVTPGALASAQEGEYDVVGNLRAFAKLYGYVRFFHPSDEAAAANWDALAVHGSRLVRHAGDELDVRRVLLDLFRPVAPTLEVFDAPGAPSPWPPYSEPFKDREGLRVVAWQHFGVRLSKRSNVNQSLRVNRDPEAEPLFEKAPGIDEATKARIMGDHLSCLVPLALYADEKGTLPRADPKKLAALEGKLAGIDLTPASADDMDARLAGVIIAWNVLQHFYPYFDVVDTDWDAVLTETLTATLASKDRVEFTEILMRMVAKLQDGHGVVFVDKPSVKGILPLRLDWIEGKVVVTATAGRGPLVKGDVILSIDGRPAVEEHFELAELVGETTAACNGNANHIPLLGGYRVMFTGMKVLKHDGSQHHLVGIHPKHPVKRTIAAVREDKDEVLAKAIEILSD